MSGLGDLGLFDLFKAEAESNCATLNQGLLAIESDPDNVSEIEPLMRAAHSIKGAARIIGLDVVVALAHAMEDRFVAVQKGQEKLTGGRVDQLLQGVDLLEQVAQQSEATIPEWSTANQSAVEALSLALQGPPPEPGATEGADGTGSASSATPGDTPAETTTSESASSPPQHDPSTDRSDQRPAPATETQAAADDAVVPVSAGSLNRMMQLASETMIASRRFQTLHRKLTHANKAQRQLTTTLHSEQTRHSDGSLMSDLNDIERLAESADQLVREQLVDLEQAAWQSERLSTELYDEVLGSRMRPFAEGVKAFPRMIRDLARSLGKKVQFEITGESVPVDREILRKLEAPLNHILRNCVDHGIETPEERRSVGKAESGRVVLSARHHAGMLTVQVEDDGRGIDPEAIRRKVIDRELADATLAASLSTAELLEFLFLPGFSTAQQLTEVSGRGVGLDVVQSMVQEVTGAVRAESQLGQSTAFTFRLPVTLSLVRAALVDIAGELYAFPLSRLVRLVRIDRDKIEPVEGRLQVELDGESVGLVSAADILGLGTAETSSAQISIIVIGQPGQLYGLMVDRFVGEQDLVVRPLDERLGRVEHLASAAILEAGEPILTVDVEDVLHAVQQQLADGRLRGARSLAAELAASSRRRILVVDDSITVREVERQLLTRHGYEVDVAVDGRDGWNALCAAPYDLLITDVDMPRMNGIQLIRTLRADSRFVGLPVIIVSYKGREEDQLLGLEAGANTYLTKGSFHDESLVTAVSDLIGGAS